MPRQRCDTVWLLFIIFWRALLICSAVFNMSVRDIRGRRLFRVDERGRSLFRVDERGRSLFRVDEYSC